MRHLFTAAAWTGDPFDVSLGEAFATANEFSPAATATLELNPGDVDVPASVELTEADARTLRDALDALLGEKRATLPW